MLGLELYRNDEDTWDTYAFRFVTTMLLALSIEVLFVVGIFALLMLVLITLTLIAQQALTYVGEVLRKRAIGNSRTARILQAATIGVLFAWLVSIGMYDNNSLGWIVLINILAFSLAVFTLTVVTIDVVEERKAAGNPIGLPSLDINDYLPWNKQPTKKP